MRAITGNSKGKTWQNVTTIFESVLDLTAALGQACGNLSRKVYEKVLSLGPTWWDKLNPGMNSSSVREDFRDKSGLVRRRRVKPHTLS